MKKVFIFALLLSVISIVSAQEAAPEANTDGTLTVSAKVTYSSKYYYTVWLKNPTGSFLRTLAFYGTKTNYFPDLTHWYSESAANRVNAVTGATPSATTSYSNTWNAKDQANTSIVADCTYTVSIEMAAEGYSAKYLTTTFIKGTSSQSQTLTNTTPFSSITIAWAPNNTAIDEVKANQYSVYPNPTRSTAYISGFDIKEIEVLTLSGKFIFATANQRMDLSALPKGVYLAKLTTNAGVFFKKIEKL